MNENGEVIDSPTVNKAVVGVDWASPAATEEAEQPQPAPQPEPEPQPEPQPAAEG